jgi:hypothetical protein
MPPLGRFRSCATAPIGPDLDDPYVANPITRLRRAGQGSDRADRNSLRQPDRDPVIVPVASAPIPMGALEIPEPENEVAIRLHDVVTGLVRGDRRAASAQLAPLVGVTCVTYPIVKMPVRSRGDWPIGSGALTRSPPQRIIAMVYPRDSFMCRYCGRWTVPTQILRLISVAFPVEFPFHPNWRRDIRAESVLGYLDQRRPRPRSLDRFGLPGPGKPRDGMCPMPVPEVQLAARGARLGASCAGQTRGPGGHDERVPGVVGGDRATGRAPPRKLDPRILDGAAREPCVDRVLTRARACVVGSCSHHVLPGGLARCSSR